MCTCTYVSTKIYIDLIRGNNLSDNLETRGKYNVYICIYIYYMYMRVYLNALHNVS